MDIKLTRADIVITASAHNPSILEPRWLKENGLIDEDPENFIHTPEFSLFDSASFFLSVDRQRLQITAKEVKVDLLERLANIGTRYVDLLPHIPFQALGLNFVWNAELGKGESLPQIIVSIGPVGDLSNILTDHIIQYGSIIYARKNPYLLRLRIEPQGESILAYNFNYHYEIKGIDSRDIKTFIESLTKLYEHSKTVVESISQVRGGRR
jgi:hypothetical protein